MANESLDHTPAATSGRTNDGVRVLLVDDEEAYVNVLASRLGRRGFTVTKAFSGSETLQVMRGQEFDVAVLDLKMADMDGIEVLRLLKIMDPDLQVIMLTGHGSATACEKGLALGAFDYLMKPCEIEVLVDKIAEAFRARRASRDEPPSEPG